MIYDIGDQPRITVRFAVNGVGTNPTAVTLTIWAPDDSSTTPSPTSDGDGVYHYDLVLTQSGQYRFKWVGTGAVEATEENAPGQILVRSTGLVLQPPTGTMPIDIINAALRLSGLMGAPERGAVPEELTEGLRVFNSMIDGMRLDGLLVTYFDRKEVPIVANQATYTIGPTSTDFTPNAADITAARPNGIDYAGLLNLAGSPPYREIPITVFTLWEWTKIQFKTLTAELVEGIFYDPTTDNGRGTIYVWPIPTGVSKLVLYLEQALAKAQSLTTSMILADGFQEMLETNLARRLAQRNPTRAKISNDTIHLAKESLFALKSANHRPQLRTSDFPFANGRGYGMTVSRFLAGDV